MSLSDLDRDWLPEPRARKFFKRAIDLGKSGIDFARKLHEKRVALDKAQDYHEAQRRARSFKDWKYLQALELHRDKMKAFPELGLKLNDFIWQDKEKRMIDKEKSEARVIK